ncbi:unnamed protein product [Moneuplotes crassus]|uniref:Uncharacterized protein n=1 Tax=Euplotes crassus TaxID=5936 RepID=A0AAD1X731_EUPCR|nr:unnamed protein product [Moneuplotes crassus]
MSNMKNNHFIPRRLQCSDLACKQHRFYFCRDHQVYSCKGCASKMHYKCQIAIIQDLTDLRTDINEVQKHVLRFQELATENGLEVYLPNINSVIKDYQEDLTEIECKINEAIAHDHHERYDTLQLSVFYQLTLAYRIQNRMANEQVIKDILFLSTTRDASRYGLPKVSDEFSSAIKVERTIEAVVKQNIKLMERKLEKEAKKIEQKCKDRLKEEYKDQVQTLQAQNEAKDTELEEQKQATERVLQDTEDIKQQKEEALDQNQTLLEDKTKLEEDKENLKRELTKKVDEIKQAQQQNEKSQQRVSKLNEELKENMVELEEAKKKIEEQVKDCQNIFNFESQELRFDMSSECDHQIIKAMNTFKRSLGDMKRLIIDWIKNENESLKTFLTHSAPSSLQSFVFNSNYNIDLDGNPESPVRIKFYLESLKEVLSKVTEEVYLEALEIDDTDLSQIFKSASSSERLIIRFSKISTSDSLDFSSPSQSKLKYLSFFNCACTSWCCMNWDEHPDRFEKIIVAIKNSSLKDSLLQINVEGCNIEIDQVNELLAAHGLSNIEVVEEENEPLED